MIAWALGLTAALAAPLDGLSPVARDLFERAEALEAEGSLSRAATAYRMVWTQQPGWSRALLAEARVHSARGDDGAALRTLDRAPFDADAVEAHGRLLLSLGRGVEAADDFRRLGTLRPEWSGVHLLLAEALVEQDPLAADEALRRYLDAQGEKDDVAVGALATELVRVLADRAETERAADLAERVLQQVQAGDALDVLREILLEQDVVEEAERLARAAALPLSPVGVDRLREARRQLRQGRVDEARRIVHALTIEEPRAAAAWSFRSAVDERAGDIGGAVGAARQAEQLDPLDADTSARLGDLLSRHYGGRLDVQAARAYQRAVQRSGADAGLWFRKAEVERRVGWRSQAAEGYRRVQSLAPDSELAQRSARILEALERPVPPPVEEVSGEGFRPADIAEEAWTSLHVAWAWQRREEPEALQHAQEAITRTLALEPRWTRAVNLDAAIHLDQGDDAGALQRYRHSLELEPGQGSVWLVVGALLRQQGDLEGAEEAVARAAALGEPEALLEQAEAAAGRWRLWDAWATLQQHRDRSIEPSERAEELEATVRRRALGSVGAAALVMSSLVAIPVALRRRRRAGVGLDALLARDARTFPEVARILAAMRHEVIKHHTTVLDAVAEALEDGDDGPATWAEERLFGHEGAVPAFYGYLAELEGLAERQGLRLNLRHGDPELAPVVGAMDELSTLEGRLASQEPERLRRLARALNGYGYRALGRRVRDLCQQTVDETFVREAWSLACRELGTGTPFEVHVEDDDGPLVVRMFRQDLLDVLVNLLRNAVQANEATGGGRVGVTVSVEEDWVTGLERVVLGVRDDSTLRLDTERLRGRFLGRGLGLAVDRVTQAGGAIHVEEADGWAKSVTVRIPRLETEVDADLLGGPDV